MALPSSDIGSEVAFFLRQEAQFRGLTPDSLTTMDLQLLAYGLRIAAATNGNKSESNQLVKIANSIDDLSDLSPSDLSFLETLSKED